MTIRAWLVTAAGVALLVAVGHTGHIPGTPPTAATPPAVTAPTVANDAGADGGDCHAEVVDTDGAPPPGTPRLDPGKLCDALETATQEAACMGGWTPPDPTQVNAREMCLEVKRRGCGDPNRDCQAIPADQTYYTHH